MTTTEINFNNCFSHLKLVNEKDCDNTQCRICKHKNRFNVNPSGGVWDVNEIVCKKGKTYQFTKTEVNCEFFETNRIFTKKEMDLLKTKYEN